MLEPYDWGEVGGRPCAPSGSATGALAFVATYAFGFVTTLVTGHLDGEELIVSTFDVFQDESGRSDYSRTERFRKQGQAGGAASAVRNER